MIQLWRMKTDKNRRLGNQCVDCNQPIVDQAVRCKRCASKIRNNIVYPPFYKICKGCQKPFKIRPSQASVIHFCSKICRTNFRVRICQNCGREFIPSHPNREQKTCSIKCRGEYKTKLHVKVEYICSWCGKSYFRFPSQRTRPNNFCSVTCKNHWHRGENHVNFNSIKCVCEMCGTEFLRTKYKVDKYGGRYCSRECSSKSQEIPGTDSYRGPNWKQQRRKARHRDKYICQRCGITEEQYGKALDVHHLVPFKEFGAIMYEDANRLSNLISLCKSCHITVERNHINL